MTPSSNGVITNSPLPVGPILTGAMVNMLTATIKGPVGDPGELGPLECRGIPSYHVSWREVSFYIGLDDEQSGVLGVEKHKLNYLEKENLDLLRMVDAPMYTEVVKEWAMAAMLQDYINKF